MPRVGREAASAFVATAVRAPFTRRAAGELLFCALGVPLGLGVIAVPLAVAGLAGTAALLAPGSGAAGQSDRTPVGVGFLGGMVALLVLLVLATRIARGVGHLQRALATRLLGEPIAAPPPVRRASWTGWLGAGLRDGPGWRAVAYLLLKVPVAVFDGYAVFLWVAGLVDVTFPFWWRLFRNHPPGVRLDPVAVLTPFGSFRVATFPGTFAAFAAGTAMVLAAPWVARAVTTVDRRLMRGLLGPGRLAQRVRDLEETRARAVDDSAALLRRVERDLHDGAQIRLAALAMNLGRAKEKLGDAGDPPDLTRARDLVDAAHRSAKDALVELRDLARGIHPPVLDNGLADALATLAADSAIPVRLRTDIPVRPTPAIETIAYFCAAELLANAAKHSHANVIDIQTTVRDGVLLLHVTDDGTGGAVPGGGTGLTGLARRVRTVDGRLDVTSPPGGPTRITVELPLRA
ncbi:MAG: histidine kinase [Actinobacteria bacterium 13_2_20CM_2_71_6]|nr:MAG: histidine kinase [Actinobacteria bacterium 13_2_20CM_2_71_6]